MTDGITVHLKPGPVLPSHSCAEGLPGVTKMLLSLGQFHAFTGYQEPGQRPLFREVTFLTTQVPNTSLNQKLSRNKIQLSISFLEYHI
jgi:hypothetical protein